MLEIQILFLHCVDVQVLFITHTNHLNKNTARISYRLRIRNDVNERLKQGNLLNRVHFESIHIIPDYT